MMTKLSLAARTRQLLAATAMVSAGAAGALTFSPVPAHAQAPHLTPSLTMDARLSFADLVEQVSPAVVSIHTEQTVTRSAAPNIPPEMERFFSDRFGEDFFERRFGPRQDDDSVAMAQGSGFFVDGDGHIVTNNHVISGAEKIMVRLDDGRELDATLVGVDPGTDLAVLKVDAPKGQTYVRFAENVALRRGDWVLAVGNPFGLGGTVTSGIVSATGRENGFSNYSDFIQIDAPINRGNSGGPTFDLKGRVVGVNTAIYSPSGGSVGIGFAIPADTASNIVRQLIDKGAVSRGWLGVQIRGLSANEAAAFGLESTDGALVVDVQDDTPAKQGGLENGDIVLKFNDEPVADSRDLTRSVGEVEPGKTVRLTVFREGKEKNLRVKLGDREKGLGEAATELGRAPASEGTQAEASVTMSLGLSLAELDADLRRELGLDEDASGVVVQEVLPRSAASEANLRAGTVILEVDNKKIRSVAGFENTVRNLVNKDRQAVILRVQEGERKDFRALPLDGNEAD